MFSIELNEDFIEKLLPAIIFTILPLGLGYLVGVLFAEYYVFVAVVTGCILLISIYFYYNAYKDKTNYQKYVMALLKKDYLTVDKIKEDDIKYTYIPLFFLL